MNEDYIDLRISGWDDSVWWLRLGEKEQVWKMETLSSSPGYFTSEFRP